MTTTSRVSDSTEAARVLAFLERLGLAPEQVTVAVAELHPGIGAGDGAAMLAALDRAREWWDAYPLVQRLMGDDDTPDHLMHALSDLQEMVARAPARCLPGMLAKARLAAWHWHECGGDWSTWESELAKTLHEGMAVIAADKGAGAGGAA